MNASYHIAKNTLVRTRPQRRRASRAGPAAGGAHRVSVSERGPFGTRKKLGDFFKEKGLPIKGAIIGQQVYDAKGVEALATMPSKSQFFASILGSINAPASKTAGVISSGIRQVLYVLKAEPNKARKAVRRRLI